MSFGKKLKELREEKNITQEQLGKIIGVSGRVVGYYESNERFPKDDTLKKISGYFKVSIDYLLDSDKTNMENQWPEGIKVLRRAQDKLNPEKRKKMLRLMEMYIINEEDET